MGGGAGITIALEIEPTYGTFRPKLHRITRVAAPVITKFCMFGYSDGMNDVRGDLLIAKKLIVPELGRDLVSYLIGQCGCSDGDALAVYANKEICDSQPRRTFWRGYVRGDIHKMFPMEIDCNLTIDAGYGEAVEGCALLIGASPQFYDFYEAVFRAEEFTAIDDELSEALYWQQVRAEYGHLPGRARPRNSP